MSDANKALVRAFYANVWNAHNPEATETYYASAFNDHNPAIPGQPGGAAGAKAVFGTFLAAFPDVHFTIDLQTAEGDVVATRWTASGTNSGSLFGAPPSGRAITITGIDIVRVSDGKIVERWGNFDLAGMLQQVGMMPG